MGTAPRITAMTRRTTTAGNSHAHKSPVASCPRSVSANTQGEMRVIHIGGVWLTVSVCTPSTGVVRRAGVFFTTLAHPLKRMVIKRQSHSPGFGETRGSVLTR